MEMSLIETRQIVSPGFVRSWDATAIAGTRYMGSGTIDGASSMSQNYLYATPKSANINRQTLTRVTATERMNRITSMASALDHEQHFIDDDLAFVSQMRETWGKHGRTIPTHLEMPFIYPTTLIPVTPKVAHLSEIQDLLPPAEITNSSPSMSEQTSPALGPVSAYTSHNHSDATSSFILENSEEDIELTEPVSFDTWTALLEDPGLWESQMDADHGAQESNTIDALSDQPPSHSPHTREETLSHEPPLHTSIAPLEGEHRVYDATNDYSVPEEVNKLDSGVRKNSAEWLKVEKERSTLTTLGIESIAFPRYLCAGPFSTSRKRASLSGGQSVDFREFQENRFSREGTLAFEISVR
ncbi:hypothetical protein SISNIDRAFT_498303 [Sistotremastrum niveocremeum HHB9708]|uniref:Uncharacterized protein n=1 Tax=Sistotremastrum niveocremeum HHB9708 TaxID=1314777 RepID=A0A164NKY9_9AGAM|nr:hypothetical protein SISNIDRAFT_498303 [Sistotremastrum niveocremeum HHB9708]